MELYMSGVMLAFVINVGRSIYLVSTMRSAKTRNMRKVKMYYDLTTGGFSKTKPGKIKLALVFGELLLVSPLLSWLSIGLFVISLIRIQLKKGDIPEKIKEINFKLSSLDLPKAKVREYLNEFASFYGVAPGDFRTLSDDEDYDSNELVLEERKTEDDWSSELYLDRGTKRYTITTRSPDYSSTHTTIYKYKIDSGKIYSRTIEHKFEYYLEAEYDIRDGVVLEKEAREQYSQSPIMSSAERVEERIRDLYERVKWNEPAQRIKYFLMFKDERFIDEGELKKYFRGESERIRKGCDYLTKEVEKNGGRVVPVDFDSVSSFTRIRYKDGASEEDKEAFDKLVSDIGKFGISSDEFNQGETILKELSLYISRLD